VSICTFPANDRARIKSEIDKLNGVELKEVFDFHNYAIMDDKTVWDKNKAVSQIREKSGSKDAPSKTYKDGFFYFDSEKPDDFTSYKLPYVFVDGGNFKVVPKALSAVVGALAGSRGGIDIPQADKTAIKSQINKYYEKMGRESPFKSDITYIDTYTLRYMEKRDINKIFDDNVILFDNAKKWIANQLGCSDNNASVNDESFIEMLKKLQTKIEKL
jgi:hypothetical protein